MLVVYSPQTNRFRSKDSQALRKIHAATLQALLIAAPASGERRRCEHTPELLERYFPDHVLHNFHASVAEFGRNLAPKSAKLRQSWTKLDQLWLASVHVWPMFAVLGQMFTEVGHGRATITQNVFWGVICRVMLRYFCRAACPEAGGDDLLHKF